jgi:hypothetical protein
MFQVYYLEKYPITSNAFTISRTEQWEFAKDKSFNTIEEAKEYIKNKTKSLPDFVLYAEGYIGDKRNELLEKFCFTDDFLLKNRFFLEPCKDKIIVKLQHEGIKII